MSKITNQIVCRWENKLKKVITQRKKKTQKTWRR